MFVTAFAQRGLIAEWGLSWLLPRLVGPAVTLDLLYTSRRVNGEEAYRLGIAEYFVPREGLAAKLKTITDEIILRGPLALHAAKRAVHFGLSAPSEAALENEVREFLRVIATKDGKEGLDAFLAKRKPAFTGE